MNIIKGDATCPLGPGLKIIAHICNDSGKWGRGFVLSLSKRFPKAEKTYREWYNTREEFGLGKIQLVFIRDDLIIANMVAQRGIVGRSNPVPLRYDALRECLKKLADYATKHKATVHMPKIGCGLGGSSWDKIKPIIEEELCEKEKEVTVTIYEL